MVHVTPESDDLRIWPWYSAATILEPSEDMTSPLQSGEVTVAPVASAHVAPESDDVHMLPKLTVAASLEPSADIVTQRHFRNGGGRPGGGGVGGDGGDCGGNGGDGGSHAANSDQPGLLS